MMRSLFAGVAGLRTHQTRMDVIGNNIANVNTTAYKSQSMTFSDLMYQTTQAASGASATRGGINARQIGLGSKTAAIKTAIANQGSAQSTNDPFDIMISGDAFFVVSNGVDKMFTRDGSFYIDGKGNLAMTSTGYNVLGWQEQDESGNILKKEVQPLRIMTNENMTYPPEATTQAVVSGLCDKNDADINNPDGKQMNLEIFDKQGYSYTVQMSIHAVNKDEQYYVQLDDILDSTGKSILKDANGTALPNTAVSLGLVGGGAAAQPNGVTPNATYGAATLNYVKGSGLFESVGLAAGTAYDPQTGAGKKLGLNFDATTFPNFQNVEIDFSSTFNYDKNGVATLAAVSGLEGTGEGSGFRQGGLSGITVQNNGVIYGTYDNGQRKVLGQIAVATFANPSGLSKEGENLYSSTLNSGEFDGIGVDISTTSGKMESGVLEMSNVDLSQEFTEMITTQRGFQANSRIITVSDTLLEELTNLKR